MIILCHGTTNACINRRLCKEMISYFVHITSSIFFWNFWSIFSFFEVVCRVTFGTTFLITYTGYNQWRQKIENGNQNTNTNQWWNHMQKDFYQDTKTNSVVLENLRGQFRHPVELEIFDCKCKFQRSFF